MRPFCPSPEPLSPIPDSPTLTAAVGAYTNLRRVASRSIRRLGDAAFRRRLMDMHRAMAAMGQGTLSGYLGTSRMLWRAIAADGMIHPDECLLLMGLASQVRQGVIVEIGSYRGRSTIALAVGSSRGQAAPVYAIEPHENFTGVLGGRFGPEDKTAFQRNIARSTLSRFVHLISATPEAAADPGVWRSGYFGSTAIIVTRR